MFRSILGPWALTVSTAFVLVLASSIAGADGSDADGDGVPDTIEQATQRNVYPDFTHGNPRSFSISSWSVGAPADDFFRVDYEAGRFALKYVRNAESGVVTNEYSVEFVSLIEWLDANGDDRLQTDEIVGYVPLNDGVFENSTVSHAFVTSADGGRVDTFTVRTADSSVVLVVTIAQRFMRLSADRVLTPMEVELDLRLNHTFLNPSEFPGARLGLDLHVRTEGSMSYAPKSWDEDHGFSRDESWVEITKGGTGGSSAFFSWSDLAKVDGVSGPVQVTTVDVTEPGSSEKEYDLYFAYPAGQNPARVSVVHDPTLGVVSRAYEETVNAIVHFVPPVQPDLFLYGLSLVAVALLVGATVFVARRRRQKD